MSLIGGIGGGSSGSGGSGGGSPQELILVKDMFDGATNSPAALSRAGGTTVNDGAFQGRAFAGTGTNETVYFTFTAPDNYDESTGISFRGLWAPSNGNAGTVTWEIRLVSVGDNEDFDVTQTHESCRSTDTSSGTGGNLHIGPDSGKYFSTVISKGDLISVRLHRRQDLDTYGSDANLLGIKLYWETD